MSSICFLFRTARFNLSKVGEHFINPCCFGEDLAFWLRGELVKHGIRAEQPYQEDWGWEFKAISGGETFYIGIGGTSLAPPARKDTGEWRVFVEKRRSLWRRLTGSGKLSQSDGFPVVIQQILCAQPEFEGVRFETKRENETLSVHR